VGHVRPLRLLSMSRRSNSILLDVGLQEPWGPAPRIAVAHQIAQKWIGGAVWVGPDDPAHEAESYWFSEGVARFFARAILFRVGLLEPDEVRDSIAVDLATLHTSPLRAEGNAALAAHVQGEGAMALLTARGSLYALGVDARLRAHGGHDKSLDAVMLALFQQARDAHHRVLPTAAWLDPLKRELGDEEARIFEQAVVRGQQPAIPPDALGPCFRRVEGRYPRFDLGFDEAATKASAGHAVAGLSRSGPAARAGVRAGDVLVRASFEPGWAEGPVKLDLMRGDKPLQVTYLPAGSSVPGPTWVRRKEVPNERCRP
jgi:predicted metalloprotease with PDZ domain